MNTSSYLFVLFYATCCLLVASALGPYSVDTSKMSVSGLSSGGYFAVQMQVAFSKSFIGAGIFAGGPYYCAKGSMITALTSCMSSPSMLDVDELVASTKRFETNQDIDALDYLRKQKIFLYSGTQDSVVNPQIMKSLQQYFKLVGVPDANVAVNFNTPSQHAMITDNFGNDCDYLGSPYINNCKYDGAGATLKWIYGNIKPRGKAIESNLIEFSQADIVPHSSSLGDKGFLYVPTECQKNATAMCKLHLALHGCKQDYTTVGDAYITKTGFNEYAETNNIIIVYPQTKVSYFNPSNPNGCYDWWGYADSKYYAKTGLQMTGVKKIIEAVTGKPLQ